MTFRQAAEVVLRATQRPMTAHEIVQLAVRDGLIQPRGKTPEATMNAALYTAPPNGVIRREFRPGPTRAARGSVRWVYVGEDA